MSNCMCPAYKFPHRRGGGKCGGGNRENCYHPSVEVTWRLYAEATLYDPREYVGVGTCRYCGATMAPEDVPDWSEVVEEYVYDDDYGI